MNRRSWFQTASTICALLALLRQSRDQFDLRVPACRPVETKPRGRPKCSVVYVIGRRVVRLTLASPGIVQSLAVSVTRVFMRTSLLTTKSLTRKGRRSYRCPQYRQVCEIVYSNGIREEAHHTSPQSGVYQIRQSFKARSSSN